MYKGSEDFLKINSELRTIHLEETWEIWNDIEIRINLE